MKGCGRVRIVVISDSHGNSWNVKKVLSLQREAQVVCFLGDGLRDAEACIETGFSDKAFYLVRGNCDWDSTVPNERVIEVAGVRIFMTHGHTYYVRDTDRELANRARSAGAQIALYGHTHRQRADYDDGLYLVNPGACQDFDGKYAVLDITQAGIVPVLMNLG